MCLIFKGFSLKFSSYHRHKRANLDKLILLFSRATFNTVIKAAMYRNISIQICKTQGKQIVLWAVELTKPSFLWICPLSAAVSHHCSNSPDYCPVISCDLPYHNVRSCSQTITPLPITYLLAGVEAMYAVVVAELCGAMLGDCCQSGGKIAFKNSIDCEAESITFVLFSLLISCRLQKSSRISL